MDWIYESGYEYPEILGSGSQISSVERTANESEAMERVEKYSLNHLHRFRFEDGKYISQFYNFHLGKFE